MLVILPYHCTEVPDAAEDREIILSKTMVALRRRKKARVADTGVGMMNGCVFVVLISKGNSFWW